jgi:predicted PolB exonuclease-like 3'-5' exonuclease
MSAVLCFDLETIPDVRGLRRIHGLPDDLPDDEVAQWAFQKARSRNGSDFLPLHVQRVIVISCALRSSEGFTVWSLAEPCLRETDIIARFFRGIERYTPQLVSWNGGGFDLPVLHYRGLIHGVDASRYWEMGEGDDRDAKAFKWNNYISRYHTRHLDLMDLLALYQPRAYAPLDELAQLMGLPGKLGMNGGAVWQAWCEGRMDEIRDYCETDVVNTYLVYLRFQKMRGQMSAQSHDQECSQVRDYLLGLDKPHWRAFVDAWPRTGDLA